MGDKEDARGYLYLAMACVLAAVREDGAVSVQFEPDLSGEAVDIAFQHKNGTTEAVRVMLASLPLTEPDALVCFTSFAARTPGATACKLKIIEGGADKALSLPDNLRDKLEIIPNDFARFEAAFMEELKPVLESQGFRADDAQLQFVISAICYRFNQFATNARFIPARIFLRKLLSLVELYYPDVPEGGTLKLQFYHGGCFSGAIGAVKPGLVRNHLIRERMAALRGLYHDISAIPLCPKPAADTADPYSHDDTAYCEYGAETQAALREQAKAILRLALPDGFFHVGALKRKDAVRQDTGFWDTPAGLEGSPIEQHKFEKLEQFAQGLTYLAGLLRVYVFLDRYDAVPLVLTNAGGNSDKRVRVRVELPKEASLLTRGAFPQPELCVLKDLTSEDGLLHPHLKQESDANVTHYHVSYYPPAHFSYLYLGPQRQEQEQKERVADFAAYMDAIFHFRVYDDEELNRRVIEVDFEAIRPGQSIAFPCFLFVRSSKGFTLRYRITSETLSVPVRGRVEYGV